MHVPMHPCGSWAHVAPLRAILAGESNLMQWFWGLLMRFDLFPGLRQSLTTLCACVHTFHVSVRFWSLLTLLCVIPRLWQVSRRLLTSLTLFTSRSQCSARVRTHPTRPFDFPTFVARPRAVLHLWPVTRGPLTFCRSSRAVCITVRVYARG